MDWTTIAIAILTGGGFAFVQFLITRSDDKDEEKKALEKTLADIKEQLKKNEKDTIRTQMLLLILMKPEEKQEILTLAEHYFITLKGNWYMTALFKKYCKNNNIEQPDWFE